MGNLAQELSETLAGVVESNGNGIVRVEARHGPPASGVVYAADGVIVTSSHAVEREDGIEIGLPDGGTAQATLTGRDQATDLAVLKVNATGLAPLKWSDGAGLKVGHLVLALARPGRTARATLGIVSALGPSWRAPTGGKLDRYLQADIQLFPGFSGGALVNLDGQALGLTTTGLLRRHPLAIPSTNLRKVVDAIVAHGTVKRGYLGVGIYPVRLAEPVAQQVGQATGALLLSVQPGSAAEQAGLVQGDVLISLDGTAVGHPGELSALLDEEKVGKEVTAKVARAGQIQELKITVGARG
ncbi:MAG TPA: trypsin-like peptidase domain-containing protein [Myxococcaceae bacterium]|nr:trypsin-like peptidase domain-containing protein [Myxococcaceae bacterium]